MNTFFNDNKLKNNLDKTKIMILSKNNELKKGSITLDGKIISHSTSLVILGTRFNQNLEWSDHMKGSNGLITQLKRRLSAVRMLSKLTSMKFASNLANSLFISKLNYHIEVWGSGSRYASNKIYGLMIETAKSVIRNQYGKSDSYYLDSMKWNNFDEHYEKAICNLTHKIITCDKSNRHRISNQIIENRSVRARTDNKLGPKSAEMGSNTTYQKSFIYRIKSVYNNLPRTITLLSQHNLFKKWIKKYYLGLMKKSKPKLSCDNTENDEIYYNPLDACMSNPLTSDI